MNNVFDILGPEPPQPRPYAATLAGTLDNTEAFIKRYVALTEAQRIAVTRWTAHCHAIDATSTTPYLHATSPEPECGKTRLFECLEAVTPSPLYAANMTPAVLFRAVQQRGPTLFIDEADNLMRDREGKGELLGLLNAGYRRGALAYRMGGGNRDKLESFETFCPKAIAGLDDLVATLASGCLRIEMQRRKADEPIEDFFREEAHAEAAPIHDALAEWATEATDRLRIARPKALGVRDRLEEALRLPLAIAEMAGERWDTRARDALRELAGVGVGVALSERLQLLTDMKQVFEDRGDPAELTSADLLADLVGLDESPWRGWWGIENKEGEVVVAKGAARKLSNHLRALKIRSQDIGPEDKRRKGYLRADFEEMWKRYLPQPPPLSAHSAQIASQSQKTAPPIRADEEVLRGYEPPENGSTEPSARNARIEVGDSGTEDDLDSYAARFRADQAAGRWGR
jgi:hypothetical protein